MKTNGIYATQHRQEIQKYGKVHKNLLSSRFYNNSSRFIIPVNRYAFEVPAVTETVFQKIYIVFGHRAEMFLAIYVWSKVETSRFFADFLLITWLTA